MSSVVNIQKKYAGQDSLLRVWAPQTIFDKDAGKYLIYWSMKHGENADIIYYAYANSDFTDIEGEPKPLFVPQNKDYCIDGDIIYKDSLYFLFCKSGEGIRRATTKSLTSGVWTESPDYKQQTLESVEGSGIFKLINSDAYILMYDMYKKHGYQFTKSTDLDKFEVIDDSISMNFHPRHGTILPITGKELKRLIAKWGKPEGFTMLTNKNPVLEGYFADPEILYAEKTGKFYLYPTSDGFTNWSGTYFKTFSSDNLKEWKDEGIILTLGKDVKWADRNAWAPCIIEKKSGNSYKYYYYFTAAQKIGVAVSDDPCGPFIDSGKPIVATRPEGTKGGQEIDPDVFTDTKTGKSYLYWGNGHMAVAELNKDMVSIDEKTIKVITPDNTFREGTYVFYRKGLYYFLWSQDDTRSENYCVRYGYSKSPMGPITIPENNLVLSKVPEKSIYGTGHNSVLQLPNSDEWYIVYHRFSRPNGFKMGRAAGYHREVCIDKMEFNENGTIKRINPQL
jgi:beta-xylosidase